MNAVITPLCNKQITEGKLDTLLLRQNLDRNQFEITEASDQVNFKNEQKTRYG